MRGVLTLAGEGTRMLPWTRGLRKEFLPLFDRSSVGAPILKPVAHLVLEALVAAGIDDVTLVVRAKDVEFVRQYFTVDPGFLRRHADKSDRLRETRQFYDTLTGLQLHFAIQSAPRGFGDAVLQAAPFVGQDGFLLHAADAVLVEPRRGSLIERMGRLQASEQLDAVLLVRRVADPTRYGVVEGVADGRFEGSPRLRVTRMEEKPPRPRSQWAATAVYAFSPRLFEGLRAVRRQRHPTELEVTDAIRWLIDSGGRVAALVLRPADGEWRSVGSPDGYLRALKRTQAISRRPSTA
jgi:UTP--glucose-1-phosphate uridylyltransferase